MQRSFPPATLRLEALEPRYAPSVAEPFDATPAGGLPAGWSQWSSAGAGAFAVTTARSVSVPNGLAVTTVASGLNARAWADAPQPANVRVRAALYADSLIPAQVLARGTALNTAAPSYYAVSVTRGLEVKLLRVAGGVSTTLGQVKSVSWFSDRWATVTLSVNGPNLRAQVQRPDTGQYLNPAGQWQPEPAWALNLTDPAITGDGRVGLGRPGSYAGTVTFDDFAADPVTDEPSPPAVTVTAPAEGATLSGVTSVQADATDNVGVTRVEFYLDNVLRAVDDRAPYRWDFDTAAVGNGAHTLTALAHDAAGNVGRASVAFTTQNDLSPLPRPTIPQHYSHIRIGQLAYGQLGAAEDQLLRDSVDLVILGANNLGHIEAVAPDTPQLLYTNVTSLYRELLADWLAYADARGVDREGAFYHVVAPAPFSGNSPSSQPVNWFPAVYAGNVFTTDLTWGAHDPSGGNALPGPGESLFLGYHERFREVNFALASGAAGGWSAVLEYPTAVDAGGKPTAWAPLATLADTTAGLTRSGRVTFDPPADWKAASLRGSPRYYFVRFRTTAGGTAPVANTVLGRDFVGAAGSTAGTIPAFDRSADANADGYLSDAEYAGRAAGKDARFYYESRAFYPGYGQMRFAANPADLGFRGWVVDYHVRTLAASPLADGLFVDNSGGQAPVAGLAVFEPWASWTEDYATLLYAVGRAVAPRWLMANTAGAGVGADQVARRVQGYFEEFTIRPLAHHYQHFESLAALVARRAALTSPAPYAVLDSHPVGGSPTDARTQLATLAYYYLLADPETTFLDPYGGAEPGTSWTRHWSPAFAYDVGRPAGPWSLFAGGADPANPALAYRVYQRPYANALVLYKPQSYGSSGAGGIADGTATTHALDGAYYPLRADGTLGPAVRSVTLRNGEGAILVKGPPPALAVGDVTVTEGNLGTAQAVFSVSLSGPATYPVTVNYFTADGSATAGGDYQVASGTLTFAPGETAKTVAVRVNGDLVFEPDETFFLRLANADAAPITGGQGRATVVNDDSLPRVRVGSGHAVEGNGGPASITFLVTLSNANYQAVTVSYATADGSAVAGSDYQAASGTLTFAPGETAKTVAVRVNGDRLGEPDESVFLDLGQPVNASAEGRGEGTILDDEPRVSVGDASIQEGDGGTSLLTFTVTLSAASDGQVTVRFATQDGSAVAGGDYASTSGLLTFQPGQLTRVITVPILGDTTAEADESFFLVLSDPANGFLLDPVAVGALLNDDR